MNSTSVASHTFKGSRDVLEAGGPELRPLPAERSVNSGAVRAHKQNDCWRVPCTYHKHTADQMSPSPVSR